MTKTLPLVVVVFVAAAIVVEADRCDAEQIALPQRSFYPLSQPRLRESRKATTRFELHLVGSWRPSIAETEADQRNDPNAGCRSGSSARRPSSIAVVTGESIENVFKDGRINCVNGKCEKLTMEMFAEA